MSQDAARDILETIPLLKEIIPHVIAYLIY
jgi:hypothetical protein